MSQKSVQNIPKPVIRQPGKELQDKRNPWKVMVFFLPAAGSRPTGPPNGKNWLDLLLLILKVAAAGVALWKAVAMVS